MHQNKNILDKYKSNKIKFFNDPFEAVSKADCVMTDIWVSMGENNSTKKSSLFQNFQINDNVMKQAKNNSLFMHCLPAHRSEEVTDLVIDGKNSIVWEQAKNRMFVQQSILNFSKT